jgi:hypothetical protein
MHGVMNCLFFVGFDRNTKLHRLRIRFRERVRFFRDVPVYPAKEVLDDANLHRFFLMIAQRDFNRFVELAAG